MIAIGEFTAVLAIKKVLICGGIFDDDSSMASGRIEFAGLLVRANGKIPVPHPVSVIAVFEKQLPLPFIGTIQTFDAHPGKRRPAYRSNIEVVLPYELFAATANLCGYPIDFEAIHVDRDAPFVDHIIADIRRAYFQAEPAEPPYGRSHKLLLRE